MGALFCVAGDFGRTLGTHHAFCQVRGGSALSSGRVESLVYFTMRFIPSTFGSRAAHIILLANGTRRGL